MQRLETAAKAFDPRQASDDEEDEPEEDVPVAPKPTSKKQRKGGAKAAASVIPNSIRTPAKQAAPDIQDSISAPVTISLEDKASGTTYGDTLLLIYANGTEDQFTR